jgi:hypothetical protein
MLESNDHYHKFLVDFRFDIRFVSVRWVANVKSTPLGGFRAIRFERERCSHLAFVASRVCGRQATPKAPLETCHEIATVLNFMAASYDEEQAWVTR